MTSSIKSAWRQISVGDRVTIAYAPGPGVTLELNERVIARTQKHDVVDALLRTWAECEPVPQRAGDFYAAVKLGRQHRGLRLDERDLWVAATAPKSTVTCGLVITRVRAMKSTSLTDPRRPMVR